MISGIFGGRRKKRKAREAARKARDAARGVKAKKETGLKAKMQISNKFIDCTNKNQRHHTTKAFFVILIELL